jgi:ribonuclease HI
VNEPDNYYASGYRRAGTNNTAELLAVLNALRYVASNRWHRRRVSIVTDSLYVVNGAMGWRHAEAVHNFKGILNGGLWRKLHHVAEGMKALRVVHIKGHAGHYWNEYCDRMAGAAVREGNARANMTGEN